MNTELNPRKERLPAVTRESDPETYDGLDELAQTMFGSPETSPFIIKRQSDGGLVGPFPFFAAAPKAGHDFMATLPNLAQIPGLPDDAREIAILVVGARYKAAYELYAHINVATKKLGMSAEDVEALARGERPQRLNEACSVTFDAATYLVGTPGPLPQELWDRCVRALGKEGTVKLVHYVGAYAYTCIILNAMDAPVPE